MYPSPGELTNGPPTAIGFFLIPALSCSQPHRPLPAVPERRLSAPALWPLWPPEHHHIWVVWILNSVRPATASAQISQTPAVHRALCSLPQTPRDQHRPALPFLSLQTLPGFLLIPMWWQNRTLLSLAPPILYLAHVFHQNGLGGVVTGQGQIEKSPSYLGLPSMIWSSCSLTSTSHHISMPSWCNVRDKGRPHELWGLGRAKEESDSTSHCNFRCCC